MKYLKALKLLFKKREELWLILYGVLVAITMVIWQPENTQSTDPVAFHIVKFLLIAIMYALAYILYLGLLKAYSYLYAVTLDFKYILDDPTLTKDN